MTAFQNSRSEVGPSRSFPKLGFRSEMCWSFLRDTSHQSLRTDQNFPSTFSQTKRKVPPHPKMFWTLPFCSILLGMFCSEFRRQQDAFSIFFFFLLQIFRNCMAFSTRLFGSGGLTMQNQHLIPQYRAKTPPPKSISQSFQFCDFLLSFIPHFRVWALCSLSTRFVRVLWSLPNHTNRRGHSPCRFLLQSVVLVLEHVPFSR